MLCHQTLEAYLQAYLEQISLRDETKSSLFRTIARGTAQLSPRPLPEANAYAIVRRRALAAGIDMAIGNHTFRATGITAYLKDGGTPENAAVMAHVSPRTTVRYSDLLNDVKPDEVERIFI